MAWFDNSFSAQTIVGRLVSVINDYPNSLIPKTKFDIFYNFKVGHGFFSCMTKPLTSFWFAPWYACFDTNEHPLNKHLHVDEGLPSVQALC